MNIVIFRRRFTPWSVDGTLVINGVFFSGTVEHPKKYMAAGRYKVAPVPIRFQKKIEVCAFLLSILICRRHREDIGYIIYLLDEACKGKARGIYFQSFYKLDSGFAPFAERASILP